MVGQVRVEIDVDEAVARIAADVSENLVVISAGVDGQVEGEDAAEESVATR